MQHTKTPSFLTAKTHADKFASQEGRRPRLLLSKVDTLNETSNEKRIASAYADIGFDVDLSPLFQNAKDIAKQAIENDVHAIHLNALSPNAIPMVAEVIEALKTYDRDDILIVIDGNHLSETDHKILYNLGVHIILKPNTTTDIAAIKILNILNEVS
ncbi:cobalamin-dependent protein [uncultured Formosa sp.]|uniref:cobalamin-dependent protein n=1 Tax=uncultured Formosa sp. TaxID=255435 RepID=UPI0026144B91|nr:cobalamin-dependent protein [uncultured Formosa sp.]